jgi:tripartite-type tricarboxylate transporter receptor subunit TctC
VVPAAPGGAIDIVGRIVANRLTEVMGQNVIIDNRAGANNIIGTEVVARSPADGYTLLTTAGAHTINPAVYRKLPYDAVRDFTPISHMANSGGLVIVVHPSVPVKNTAGTDRHGAQESGKARLRVGRIRQSHAPRRRDVPGDDGSEADARAVQGSRTRGQRRPRGPDAAHVRSQPRGRAMVQSGRLRPLAFTGLKRSTQLPDLPTC